MPPMRSMPPAKPVKTERTHEENQERAYIAASRRSDRSLEARVESARRASEIHKRRTGRSLRVTEQDVINEEMYEEEDDDLPMQYRRLTAHLQTSNAEFDRRLQSYLAHQMGMRAPLLGNGQQFDPSSGNFQLSSRQFMNPNMMQVPQYARQNQTQQSPIMSRASDYRQTPYPMYGMRPGSHARSASIATPQELTTWYQHQSAGQKTPSEQSKPDDRRMSAPMHNSMAPPHTPTSLDGQVEVSYGTPPAVSRSSSSSNLATSHNALQNRSPRQQQPTPPMPTQPMRHASFAGPFHTGPISPGHEMGPLTASLPLESQQILALDPNDFSLGNFQQDQWGAKPQQPFYSYNPNGKPKQSSSLAESQGGMHQTLAPASHLPVSIDTSMAPVDFTSMPSADSTLSPLDPFGFGGAFDPSFGIDPLKMNSGFSSGQVTPGEADWASFVDGGAFEEPAPS